MLEAARGALSKNGIMIARTERSGGLCTEGSSSGTSRTSQCSPAKPSTTGQSSEVLGCGFPRSATPSPRLQRAPHGVPFGGVCWIDTCGNCCGERHLRGHLVTSNIMAYPMLDGDALQTGGWHTALVEGRGPDI